MTYGRFTALAATCGLLAVLFAPQTKAATLDLIALNSSAAELDLTVDISVADGLALFAFANESTGDAAGSSVARIYFEAGLADAGLSGGSVAFADGTDFADSFPGPSAPPSGNTIGWAGAFAAFGAQAPGPVNGLNVGDALTISFVYGGTLETLLDFLVDANGNSRIAAHVLDCNNGESCAATIVPVPAALPLMATALAALGFGARRRRV